MKKLKLIIVAFMVMACSASYAVGIDTSVEFALSQANFKVDGFDIDNSMGFGVGVSAKANLPIIKVGPELWYYRHTGNIEGVKFVSNSIDVPVIVSYTILGPLAIEGGPSFSLLSKGKLKDDDQSYKFGRIRPEMGYVIGARVTIAEKFMISARFNGCFSEEKVDYESVDYDVRYNSWAIGVGMNF